MLLLIEPLLLLSLLRPRGERGARRSGMLRRWLMSWSMSVQALRPRPLRPFLLLRVVETALQVPTLPLAHRWTWMAPRQPEVVAGRMLMAARSVILVRLMRWPWTTLTLRPARSAST